MNYYNEFDAYAALWLRNLIAAGLIPPGHVDTRSITDVRAADLAGFTQCHFFAGIAGWPLALSLVRWPADKPVWTGSCPCQPLSSAGKQRGHADERHLWPAFHDLIAECKPATVFGEQVASKDGREWLAGVRADLEAVGYAVGAADLCAAGVGAPHIRQRLFWVADASGATGRLADTNCIARENIRGWRLETGGRGTTGRLGNADKQGLEGFPRHGADGDQSGWINPQSAGQAGQPGAANFWAVSELIPCADGKTRRVEPGVSPLAHGFPGRVGLLKGYGNAIVPQVAAEFIQAYTEALTPRNI